jgi:hypothetical protein
MFREYKKVMEFDWDENGYKDMNKFINVNNYLPLKAKLYDLCFSSGPGICHG